MKTVDTISLFDFDLLSATQEDAVNRLLDSQRGKRTAAFLNAHCINTAQDDPSYVWALKKADLLLPDGSGMSLAAKLRGERFADNLNGTDLFVPLCKQAAERGLSVFFFGSRAGVADAAAEAAQKLAPGLTIAGTQSGYFNPEDEDSIIDMINASGAGIVLVALGVPMQDVWIARNRHRLDAKLVMGVGAQFDFWSGRVPRAPLLLRRIGCEWCWRLLIEPRRMAKRYLVGNVRFLLNAFRQRKRPERAVPGEMDNKRVLDLVVSGCAIMALAPVMLAIAAAIRFNSPGPALFRQTRIGQNGAPFTVLKFRSMYRDAEARRAALLAHSDRDGICFKSKNDPRITPVGRWLRRFSLDELPQLFNIWAGDMSVVGPRPALPQEVEAYPAPARERLSRKPGLTGLWQVAGRAEIGFDKMVEMDSAYVRSRTILLDLAILALTVRAVLGGRGAF